MIQYRSVALIMTLFLITSSHVHGASKASIEPLQKALCAVVSKVSTRKHLQELNPWLTAAEIDAKIEACDSPFMFMRAFVSSYYDLIAKGIPGHAERFASLKKHQGWIVGDAHPENFGALLNDKGEAVFTMNDLDDFSRGPLYVDILRHLSAARLYDKEIDVKDVLKAYEKGLKGKDWEYSKAVRKLLKKSEKRGLTIDPDRPDDAVSLKAAEKEKLQNWVQDKLGSEFEFKSAYKRNRVQGGSGGLQRYELMLKYKAKSHYPEGLVPVELKELTIPSTFPIQNGELPSVESRIQQGLNVTLGEDASRVYRVVEFDGKKMLMRPRWRGNIAPKLDDLKEKRVEDTIEDEAYLLGSLHRKSAKDVDAYLEAFKEIPKDVWDEESALIAKAFKKIYKELP